MILPSIFNRCSSYLSLFDYVMDRASKMSCIHCNLNTGNYSKPKNFSGANYTVAKPFKIIYQVLHNFTKKRTSLAFKIIFL